MHVTTDLNDIAPCPCGSGNTYDECCAPLHRHQQRAKTAHQLMRSRFTAFVNQDINYLIQTTCTTQRHQLDKNELATWIKRTHWQRLEIIDQSAGQANDINGEVEFKAWYSLDNNPELQCHHERSQFLKEATGWCFIDPTIEKNPTPGRNSPCPCGSVRKYKRCCGR